jgi:hypothetical protein
MVNKIVNIFRVYSYQSNNIISDKKNIAQKKRRISRHKPQTAGD